jgi:hypothetical protein
MLLMAAVAGKDCTPWGVRLSLGDHYANTQSNHYLFIAFNTDVHKMFEMLGTMRPFVH